MKLYADEVFYGIAHVAVYWKDRANKIPGINFRISHFLERKMRNTKIKGMDIADYFAGGYSKE